MWNDELKPVTTQLNVQTAPYCQRDCGQGCSVSWILQRSHVEGATLKLELQPAAQTEKNRQSLPLKQNLVTFSPL